MITFTLSPFIATAIVSSLIFILAFVIGRRSVEFQADHAVIATIDELIDGGFVRWRRNHGDVELLPLTAPKQDDDQTGFDPERILIKNNYND